MNKDIQVMIELQEYWDIILAEQKNIEKNKEKINVQKQNLSKEKNDFDLNENSIKELKNKVKQDELKLNELDEKSGKLKTRKDSVHNEKELQAVSNELEKITADISDLEEQTLIHMDELEELEKKNALLRNNLTEMENKLTESQEKITDENNQSTDTISKNQGKFDESIVKLSPAYKSKFLKLLKSKNGSAVAEITGEICGSCNFKIPASLAIDSTREDKVATCTNCGRFIYGIAGG